MKRLTRSISGDLCLMMMGFGILIGMIFPFFAKAVFRLPANKALSPLFFSLCVLAGILVGLFNYWIFRLTVYNFIALMSRKINKVRENLDSYYLHDGDSYEAEECLLEVRSDDIIGHIAGSFNQFIGQIQNLIEGEKKIDQFQNELQKGLAIHDVADIVIKYFARHFGGDGACIFGLDRGEFRLMKHWNIEVDISKINQEFFHQVFSESQVKVFENLENGEFQLNIGIGAIKPRHIAYIPVRFQDKNVGIAVLISRNPFHKDFHHVESRNYVHQASPFLYNSALMKRLEELAAIDELTGVLNRRFGLKRLNEEFERSRRHQIPMAICMVDIDNFKSVNDTYGHQCGDYVLKTISGQIDQNVRASDFALRYGGEEFMVVLPGASVTDSFKVMDRVRKMVETQTLQFGSYQLNFTFSGGIAGFPAEGIINTDVMTQKADDALYKAKQTGKNKIVITA